MQPTRNALYKQLQVNTHDLIELIELNNDNSNLDTIDWNAETSKQKHRNRNSNRILSTLVDWIIVVLIGACTGLLAAFIEVASEWLSDIKNGFCMNGFYLTRRFCCFNEESCLDWFAWSNSFLVGYFVWILLATLFATTSALFCIILAPHACGSG